MGKITTEFNNVLTEVRNIFIDKNEAIKKYVEYLEKQLFEEEKHPWMRSDLFKDENYQCDFNGKKISLSPVFWENESIRKENIIIISGEKHIGKSFFVEKILKECIALYMQKNGKFNLGENGKYRIPILVFREWFKTWLEKQNLKELNLENLIYEVIIDAIEFISDREKENLKEYITKVLAYGKFVIYFESNEWIETEELSELLKYGKEFVKYRNRTKYHNIVLLTSDMERGKNSFLTERNCGYIRLKELREDEITAYLEKNELDFLLSIAKENPDVMRLMGYPEHLRMFEILCNDKLISKRDLIKNRFQLYDFFIRQHIKNQLEEGSTKENKIFEGLQKYAWEKCVLERNGQGKTIKDAVDLAKNKCGLITQNDTFSFPYCGYYLAALELIKKVEKLGKNNLKSLHPDKIKEENIENILIFASQMIEDERLFSKYWEIVAEHQKYPLLLLAKIIKYSKYKNAYEEELYRKAFEHLKSEFYDYSVLETFEELKPDCAEYLKNRYFLLNKYEEAERINIKKRMIYYLGISHNGILNGMIDELISDDTDRHLQYHIIRAAVENYQAVTENEGIKNEKTKELIDKRIEEIARYCNKNQDPIIMSDFCVLYRLCKKEEWQSPKNRIEMLMKLEEKLEDKIYWVRAHAAGAIGRMQERNTVKLLLQRIQSELQIIYELNNDYRNSIKVISYSVEAICEWYNQKEKKDKENAKKEKDNIIREFTKLIEVSKMRNQDVEDAYSTIVTGIEYIISENKDKPAFNLGGRFRNRTSNHRRVVVYILDALLEYYKDDEEFYELVKEKCEKLRNITMQEIPAGKELKRMLHLSDLHLIEDGTHNNMILNQIKNYCPIDILLITGDLKQFGADYIRTLELFNKLKTELNLEEKDIFIVPGNHDSQEIANQETIYNDVRNGLYEDPDIYRKYSKELYSAFDEYDVFAKKFFGSKYYDNGGIHNKVFAWEDSIQILCINTSLVCDGNQSNHIVNTYELSKLENQGEIPLIAISHHPFASLHDAQSEIMENLLKQLKVSALLSGDKHYSSMKIIGTKEDGIPNLVIGKSLKEVKDTYSEVNIAIYDLNFERKEMAIYLKKWENGVFVPSMKFSELNPYPINLLY